MDVPPQPSVDLQLSDLELRRRLAIRRSAMAAALMSLLAFGLVFPFPLRGRLWGELFNLAHAPSFFLVLLSLVGFLDPPAIGMSSRHPTLIRMSMSRSVVMTGGLMLVGLAGEYLQQFADRSPSFVDVAANCAGLLAALLWIAGMAQERVKKRLLIGGGCLLLILVNYHPAANAIDCVQQIRSFPRLASFERPREFGSWYASRAEIGQSREWASDGEFSAEVRMKKAKFPSVSMFWIPEDWSDYKSLSFEVKNPGIVEIRLMLKLHDRQHSESDFLYEDRFHQEIVIPAGAVESVKIDLDRVANAPAGRRMWLSQMAHLELYGIHIRTPFRFFLDDVRLTDESH